MLCRLDIQGTSTELKQSLPRDFGAFITKRSWEIMKPYLTDTGRNSTKNNVY